MLDDHRRLKRCRHQLAQAEEALSVTQNRLRSCVQQLEPEVERIKGEIAELEKKCSPTEEEVKADMAQSVERAKSFAKGDTEKISKKPAKKKASKKG